jgi:Domain of unknown function (DUF5069)
MQPLDLTKQPPRSPRESLDGLMMMPRTIDKLRATLRDGDTGQYKIAGLSERLLELIGVKEDDLRKAVAEAQTDEDVAVWLRSHAQTSKYAETNEILSKRKIDDTKDPAAIRKKYAVAERPEIVTLFDMLDADDNEAFSKHA